MQTNEHLTSVTEKKKLSQTQTLQIFSIRIWTQPLQNHKDRMARRLLNAGGFNL